jgi:hypothetical protein
MDAIFATGWRERDLKPWSFLWLGPVDQLRQEQAEDQGELEDRRTTISGATASEAYTKAWEMATSTAEERNHARFSCFIDLMSAQEPVSDLHRTGGLGQPLGKGVVDAVLHQDAVGADAGLAAEGGPPYSKLGKR